MSIRKYSRRLAALALVVVFVSAFLAPVIASGLNDLFFGHPRRVFVFNDDTELVTASSMLAASVSETFLAAPHRLIIAFSAVGAILNITSDRTLMYLGCFVDGVACVGHQNDPSGIPAGYVSVLSNNFPVAAAWDNTVGYTWLAPSALGTSLAIGTHTVEIKVAVGNSLAGCSGGGFGCGGPGTAFIEARNLVVTVTS